MSTPLFETLHITSDVSVIVVSVALMLISGFAMTRITKRLRLPNVTAYIVAGILIGPYCFNLIPARIVGGMGFIADIALAFIAFSTGEFFKFSTLKKSGPKVLIITVMEACLASILVFIVVYFILGLELNFHRAGSTGICYGSCLHRYDHPADPCQGRLCRDSAAGGGTG